VSEQAVASRSIVDLMGRQSPKMGRNVLNAVRGAYSEKPKKKDKPKSK